MPDDLAQAESGRRWTEFLKRLEVLRRFPLALILSATLSVIFVVIVAALIAFMQYQARLLRSQPGITASQLVYYVETEKSIEREQPELGKLSAAISEDTPEFTYTSNEINFRIDRICALFEAGPDAKKDSDKCRRFLNQIPFEGMAKMPAESVPSTPSPAIPATKKAKASAAIEPISAELLNSILANFIDIMGARKFGEVEFSKLVLLFRSDLGTIAQLNQTYWLSIRPHYLYQLQTYSAKCKHLIQLINIVSTYRTIDSGCDPNLDTSRFTTSVTDTGNPAEGGSLLPAGPAGNIPVAQGAPASPPPAGKPADPPLPSGGSATPGAAPQPGAPAAAGGPPGKSPPALVPPPPPPAPQSPPTIDIPKGGSILPSAAATMSSMDRQRAFELVTHYRFYDRISGGKLRDILISPNDFLALVLVCVAGILGALLRIVFASYVSGKDPTMRSVVISPILGLICSLVIYNLFRSGFIVITDQPQNSETAALSPFVIALLAIAAGLLSERTIEFFRKTSGNWLGGVESSQAARWGVNLQREMDAQTTTAEKLAEQLDVSAAKIKEWAQEKEPVPVDKQRDIAVALRTPLRRIFTDIEPVRTG